MRIIFTGVAVAQAQAQLSAGLGSAPAPKRRLLVKPDSGSEGLPDRTRPRKGSCRSALGQSCQPPRRLGRLELACLQGPTHHRQPA